jgi:hypothetical protein
MQLLVMVHYSDPLVDSHLLADARIIGVQLSNSGYLEK